MRLFRIVSIIDHDDALFPFVWTYWLGQGRPGRGSAEECWVLWAQQSGLKEHVTVRTLHTAAGGQMQEAAHRLQ